MFHAVPPKFLVATMFVDLVGEQIRGAELTRPAPLLRRRTRCRFALARHPRLGIVREKRVDNWKRTQVLAKMSCRWWRRYLSFAREE